MISYLVRLSRFQRPSRYINSEINAVHKDAPLRVALAFPDVYEIGMSHLGLKILYSIINSIPYASAERVFQPWLDMSAAMKESGEPLRSLESGRPLNEFDVVGFSLQYELSYTTVLNMLTLGGIPLKAAERGDGDTIVIAGGPSAVNPLPMAPFVDAFLIGDGEEAVPEMIEACYRVKKEGDGRRETLLKELARIEGVFVPSVDENTPVRRRIITSLQDAPYPTSPIVPFTQIVHDRVNIEISRGCTMGCRFCQAGVIYRPMRERSPQKIIEIAEESLRNTGYEEVSFTSLSAGDYSALHPLMKEFNRRFAGRMVSVSLPSLRVGALSRELLREVKSVKKTGFTIAPEAATERLRRVINKDFSAGEYEQALESLFKEGWLNLKLYFMIGLPTEEETDIEAIPAMVMKALRIAKKHTRRYVNINVGIATFVPKPHTPFQWLGQAGAEDIKRKKDFLKSRLRKKGMKVKDHNDDMSMLEAAFSRGDKKLGELVEAAVKGGALLDGWSESFDYGIWQKAMESTGIDAREYAARKYTLDEPLAWDVVETGVKQSYLIREYHNAVGGKITGDCRSSCSACGLKGLKGTICDDEKGSSPATHEEEPAPSPRPAPGAGRRLRAGEARIKRHPIKVRVEFRKEGPLRWLSHREVITHLTRAIRRAGVPVKYSEGFSPSPKIALGPPLGVGVAGLKEYFDMELSEPFDLRLLQKNVNKALAEGLRINEVRAVNMRAESLQSFISTYEYEIISKDISGLKEFLDKKEVLVQRDKGPVDLRAMLIGADFAGDGKVRMTLKDGRAGKVRLDEMLTKVFGASPEEMDITRLSVSGAGGEPALEPMDR